MGIESNYLNLSGAGYTEQYKKSKSFSAVTALSGENPFNILINFPSGKAFSAFNVSTTDSDAPNSGTQITDYIPSILRGNRTSGRTKVQNQAVSGEAPISDNSTILSHARAQSGNGIFNMTKEDMQAFNTGYRLAQNQPVSDEDMVKYENYQTKKDADKENIKANVKASNGLTYNAAKAIIQSLISKYRANMTEIYEDGMFARRRITTSNFSEADLQRLRLANDAMNEIEQIYGLRNGIISLDGSNEVSPEGRLASVDINDKIKKVGGQVLGA